MTATVKMLMTPSGQNPLNGLDGVVTNIECAFIASDGVNSNVVRETVSMAAPDPEGFKPLGECVPADFIDWVQSAKGEVFVTWRAGKEAEAIAGLILPEIFTLPSVEVPAADEPEPEEQPEE